MASGARFGRAEEAFLDHLIGTGVLASGAQQRVDSLAEASSEPLTALLVTLGLVSERDLAARLATHLEIALLQLGDFPAEPLFAETLDPRFLRHTRTLPLSESETSLTLAMANPFDGSARAAMAFFAQKEVKPAIATPSDILGHINLLYAADETQTDEFESGGTALDLDVERLKELASEAPVIRLVNRIIVDALDREASDIHLETVRGGMRVRFRTDGQLIDVEQLPAQASAAVVSRLKIMAGLDIAEKRLAQDGRFRLGLRGKDVDFRVATMPTMHGEAVALRLLDREAGLLDFAELGFAPALIEQFTGLLDEPHGIVLVTGPTGSGKTTTLYAALNRLNRPEREILTVEDPVEYALEGVNQVQVNPQIGHSFASVLRSFLRHDPDILMVGEIRDAETAQIAIQAALTGHMVLSTLHTNDAVSALSRLLDMGAEDYLLTSVLRGVLAQRLVRKLCTECREPVAADAALRKLLAGQSDPPASAARHSAASARRRLPDHIYRPKGCAACQHTGYRGRTVIAELFMLTDEARRLVTGRADAAALARAAKAGGMAPMLGDGLAKICAGITSLDEVMRATREG